MSTESDARITNLLSVYFLTSTGEPTILFPLSLRPLGKEPDITEYVTGFDVFVVAEIVMF
jgi:hypothetical protein